MLQRYLMKQFLPVCFVALLFFIVMLELGDLFANLWKYLSNDVGAKEILRVMWLYIPKCVSYSMPLSVLFASSYTMGNMYARNELTSIFASGYSLFSLIRPLLILGIILSSFMFFFENNVVIHSVSAKNNLNRVLLKQEESLSNTNIVVLSEAGSIVYMADYYENVEKKLYSLMVIIRNSDGVPEYILQSPVASWSGSSWVLEDSVCYSFLELNKVTMSNNNTPIQLTEMPQTFMRNITSVDELSIKEAKSYIEKMKKAGSPFAEQLSNYYKRFSFPLTIFIVLFFSISLGGRFKKNIMLMSLLLSLSIAVAYYVMQMVTMLFAKWEYISPFSGAWLPAIFFIITSILILRNART